MLELDADGKPRFVKMNRIGCEIGGFSQDQIQGKTAKEMFEGKHGELLYELHLRAFTSQFPISDEYSLVINGLNRRMRTVLNPVFDANGSVIRVIGTPIDITAEYAVRSVKTRTQALNKEMEEFISLAAHDLRSPMRRVGMIAQFLREDLPDLNEANGKLLGMLENVAKKSFEMISDLISHAQAAEIAGDQKAVETFELKDLCEKVFQLLDPAHEHEWQISETLIEGERLATQIIIRNLIDNAIKHNATKLTLAVSATQIDANHFELRVSDNGKGISDGGKSLLTSGRISTDSGFGLAGVMRLVAARGGSITVDDFEKGTGATVRVRLPGSLHIES